MSFIEDERKRRELLAREVAAETPARREERARLSRADEDSRRKELYSRSEAFFRESYTPKLINELAVVVQGKVSVSRDEYGFKWNNPTGKRWDAHQRGEIWLMLNWDGKPVLEPTGQHLTANLHSRFRETEFEPYANSYAIYKSIGVVFAPSGSIHFYGGYNSGISGSNEIARQQWRGNKSVEESGLARAFKIPGEYLVQIERRPSEGSPNNAETAGPGLL